MGSRRQFGLLALVCLAFAGLALPAAAQTGSSFPPQPSITISPSSDAAGSSGTWSITVSGRDWTANRPIVISFAGTAVDSFSTPSANWTRRISVARRFGGPYEVLARSDVCGDGCIREARAQFRSVPQIALSPSCSTPQTSQTLTVNGTNWNPQFQVTVTYDAPSKNTQVVSPATNGTFSASFPGTPPNRDVVITADQGRTGSSVSAVWAPCPPPGVTTSTSASTTAPPDDTAPETVPEPESTTTTVRLDQPTSPTTFPLIVTPGPPVTVPPTVELPPVTAGATLVVSPEVGPTGFVTSAAGTGFPPGPVQLTWTPGIGRTDAVVGPDGRFSVRLLVLPNDRLGPRALVATGGSTTAIAAFLVVPSSVQPSGGDVGQITRIRRFNQR